MPKSVEIGTDIKVSFTIILKGKALTITTISSVYRIDKNEKNFHIVLLFELNNKNKHELQEYLAGRQMELIREFKKIDLS